MSFSGVADGCVAQVMLSVSGRGAFETVSYTGMSPNQHWVSKFRQSADHPASDALYPVDSESTGIELGWRDTCKA
jgi:hypothetical protein